MNITKPISVPFYDLPLIAVTRVALGAGIGLLAANRMDRQQRNSLGQMLFWVGLLSTIPIAMQVFSKVGASPDEESTTGSQREREFVH